MTTPERIDLLEAGFDITPVEGKRAVLGAWSDRPYASRGDIDIWQQLYPAASNTGILTKYTPTFDIDIKNPEGVDAVEALTRERFEERGYILCRFGATPKRAIPFRTGAPFKKIAITLIAPDGNEQKLEFLADGQQFVAFGIHPDTHKPYSWFGGEPGRPIKHDDLPYINQEEAQTLVDQAADLLCRDHGFTRKRRQQQSGGNGFDHDHNDGPANWSYYLGNLIDHDALTAFAMSLLRAKMMDGAVVNFLHQAVGDLQDVDPDRKWRRLDEIQTMVSSARAKIDAEERTSSDPTPPLPLPWLDMSTWDHQPVPERKWAIRDRVPLKQAGLFSGEGGTGKSIIELMKDVAHVAGKDWLGSLPESGPAFYLGAEDDVDEIHIRLAAIAGHYGLTFSELIEGGLHILPLLGKDATLCALTRGGKVEVTGLYRQVYEAAGDIKPKNISIDTLSRAFAGSEIDRVQVYAFAMHMQALAMVSDGSVTVLSHPSLQGIASGSGISGSTAWHGAFRFRQYLKGVKADDGEQRDDNDLREFEFKKNQYGPCSESIVLRYQRGLFLPEGGISNLDKLAREAKAQVVFLDLLRRFLVEGRNVCDKKNANNYAPTAFAREDEAKKHRLKKEELEEAMRQLFKAEKLRVETYGRPSDPRSRLIIV
ncbi:AAA family ATPase [Bradyrhizobium sp. CB82]|uniref:AAA family ATPase n=1 Tax=Bradyrhizobium sp. CB82 TaxID=3039159 RepID=UPI0024B19876|nr:AAA family ATPase [Bradyrhizobium sp. CB82]WFU37594.1 AAA family ATPase [Bradyrhizobium sp. CB82]